MKTITCIIPRLTDPTSFYRAIGPLGQLRRSMGHVNTIFPQKVDWSIAKLCDCIFMQRPSNNSDRLVAEMANEFGKPLWVDFDDDLLSVPPENFTFDHYGKEETKKNVAECCARADIVTVSTRALKEKLSRKFGEGKQLNKDIRVIPNAWDDEWLDPKRKLVEEERKLILWRGSGTHQKDLYDYKDEILELAWSHRDWIWAFMGYDPWFITQNMPKACSITVENMDIRVYLNYILSCQPAIQIVPLTDNEFNKSKSNIAWIEGTWAGATVLAPDWHEWRKPGIWTYSDPGDFRKKLRTMMMEKPLDLQREHNRKSMQFIRENLLLSKVNLLRENVLGDLVNA